MWSRETLQRWLPIVVFVGAAWVLFARQQTPHYPPVMCDSARAAPAPVVMLSASWCRYCRKARAYFIENAIDYCEFDIERTQRGAALYEQARYGAIPVIYIGESVLLGFDKREIAQALARI